jgi:hypothetical protein
LGKTDQFRVRVVGVENVTAAVEPAVQPGSVAPLGQVSVRREAQRGMWIEGRHRM